MKLRMLHAGIAAACLIGLFAPRTLAAAFKPQVIREYEGDQLVFAVIGDWGRMGGIGSDGTVRACLNEVNKNLVNDSNYDRVANACGALEQVAAAELMDQVCAEQGCQFIMNTADNFYADGCFADNATGVPQNQTCAVRIKTDWEGVYNSPSNPHIRGLEWIGSLGNHDVLGHTGGIDAQIAYSSVNPNWIMPSRYYTADISAKNGPSIRIHVAYTSCWVKSYRVPNSTYGVIDEIQTCSTPAAVKTQLDFLNQSMSSSKADYDVVLAHHPALATGWESYFDDSEATDGWTPFAQMTEALKPVAYFNGHDHAMNYNYLPSPINNISGVTVNYSFPNTGFHTSGAGSFTQAAAGGYGLKNFRPFSVYTNVDWERGVAPVGFNIVTVTKTHFIVDYYSLDKGSKVAFRVSTPRGGMPISVFDEKLNEDITWSTDGESLYFGRKLI